MPPTPRLTAFSSQCNNLYSYENIQVQTMRCKGTNILELRAYCCRDARYWTLHILYADISKLIIATSILLTFFVAGAQSLSVTKGLFVLRTDVKQV